MDRDVVRVVTPGTVVEPSLLEQKANNYLVALMPDGPQVGLAYVDITTGEFCAAQLPSSELGLELTRLSPAEALAPEGTEPEDMNGCPLTPMPRIRFQRGDGQPHPHGPFRCRKSGSLRMRGAASGAWERQAPFLTTCPRLRKAP